MAEDINQIIMKAVEFFRDVKREFARIVWPNNKNALVTTAVVVVVAVVFALVFTLFDAVIFKVVKFILNLG